ncbi:MAG: hypothetical protein Q8L29_02365 [archaeon]|nr:hypothetical protein [archaeon]
MKKMILFSIIIGLFLIINASAISVEMKESYERQETMLVKISGDIREPITSDNIVLKRGHVLVPLEYEVKRIGNDYYLWALSPLNENNYTLWINNVVTSVAGVVNKTNFAYNFTTTNVLTDYYIKPAVIYTNKDFEIRAYNNGDTSKEISVDFLESRNVILQPGDNKILFSIKDVIGTQTINFSIGKYSVKAYIIGKAESNDGTEINISVNVSGIEIIFIPQKIKREVIANEEETYLISVLNDGDDIESLSLEYDKNIFSISSELPSSLENGKRFEFNLSVKTDKEIKEEITLKADDYTFNLPIEITISELPAQNKSTVKGMFYCDELAGKICKGGEVCSIETITSLDGECCKGECAEESGSSSSLGIGYLIAALVLIGIIFIYYKYRKVKNEKNPLTRKIAEAERKFP